VVIIEIVLSAYPQPKLFRVANRQLWLNGPAKQTFGLET